MVKRFIAFVRSVLPADRAFSLLLVGSAFLFVAPSLGWWHSWLGPLSEGASAAWGSDYGTWVTLVYTCFALTLVPIRVAGAACFLVCLFPGIAPLRRLRRWVYFPAIFGVLAGSLFAVVLAHEVALVPGPWKEDMPFGLPGFLFFWHAGPGLHFAIVGLILVKFGATRIERGLAQLPIQLNVGGSAPQSVQEDDGDREVKRFVWIMTALVPVASFIGDIPSVILIIVATSPPNISWWLALSHVEEAIALLVLVVVAMGRSWREMLRTCFRVPRPITVALAFVVPIALGMVVPAAHYAYDRVHWAAFEWGRFSPPIFSTYIGFPRLALLWFFPGALVEEIAWRGYLQPRFISRYGLYRGIFLVGIVWAAFHFPGDFLQGMSHAAVLSSFARRLLTIIGYAFVLGWLAIRARSVIPAAICHTMLDIWLSTSQPFPTPLWIWLPLWGLAGSLLFRYWPPAFARPAEAGDPWVGSSA